MKIKSRLFLLLCFFPIAVLASDSDVTQWTAMVLKKTLTVDYKQTPEEINAPKKYYSPEGWTSIASFLGDKMLVIRSDKLSLHPKPLHPAKIVNTGDYAGVQYWRVNQTWRVPELGTDLTFSVIVVRDGHGSYKVSSLNIERKEASPPS